MPDYTQRHLVFWGRCRWRCANNGNDPDGTKGRRGRSDVCAIGGLWHAKPNHLFGFRSHRPVSNFDQTTRWRTG